MVMMMFYTEFAPQGQVDVCNLKPNTTYEFKLWTSNRFGKSETVSFVAVTLPSFTEVGKQVSMLHIFTFFNIYW